MNTQPLFNDHSPAGYDWTCHAATNLIADTDGYDLNNPDDTWHIINRLEAFTQKLRRHTPPPTPWTPTENNPF